MRMEIDFDLGIKLNMDKQILHKCIFYDDKVNYLLSKKVKVLYRTD